MNKEHNHMTTHPLARRTRFALAGTAVVLAAAGAVAIPLAASAHTPQATLTCDTAALSLTSYDKHATADVTLDGVSVHAGEFGGRLVTSYPVTAGVDTHTLVVHVVSRDGAQYGYDQTLTATGCAPVAPPTEEPTQPPTTPPVTPPADVVAPLVQDYITCDGSAFVLDNTGSTVDVTYTVAGKQFLVPAGTAVHTDADGFLFPADIGPVTITTTPGDKSWTFASASDCAVTPPTEEPTTPPTTEPTPEPTTPPVTDTPAPTPTPSDQPTAPTPTGGTKQPNEPTAAPSGPSHATPAVQSPKPSSITLPTSTAAPVAVDTSTPDQLAYTGTDMTVAKQVGIVGASILLVGLGATLLTMLHLRRKRNAE
jgi:hypothetical protein